MSEFDEIMQYTAEQLIPPDGAPMPGQAPRQLIAQAPQWRRFDFTRHCVGSRLADFRQKFEDGNKVKPIATGFPRLDDLFFGGLRAGLYVLSAVRLWIRQPQPGGMCCTSRLK